VELCFFPRKCASHLQVDECTLFGLDSVSVAELMPQLHGAPPGRFYQNGGSVACKGEGNMNMPVQGSAQGCVSRVSDRVCRLCCS
jgi:hypothetical protein